MTLDFGRAPRLATLACLVGLVACGTAGERAARSEQHHTRGEVIWSNAPYAWAELDPADTDEVLGTREVAGADAVTRRLQAWVDRYDRVIRGVVKDATGETLVAPAPRVRVKVSSSPQGQVMRTEACAAEGASDATGTYVFESPRLTYMSRCHRAKNWPAGGGAVDFLKGIGARVESGPGWLTVDSRPVAMVAVQSMIPFVVITTGLVSSVSEKTMAVILAHELAHYYRGHGTTAVADRYDFWFERDGHLPERPVPAEQQVELLLQYERFGRSDFAMAGLQHHHRLGTTLVRWASHMKEQPEGSPCAAFASAPGTWSTAVRFDFEHPYYPFTPEARAAYLDLDAKATACIDGKTLDDASRSAFLAHRGSPFTQEEWTADVSTVPTLRALVDAMEAHARSIDVEEEAFEARLATNGIGLYTTEQEADDFAMDVATRIGIEPTDVVHAFVDLMTIASAARADECSALLAAGFEKDGVPVRVPLGELSSKHHSSCYRVFNLWHEMRAHAYPVAPRDFPPDSPPWSEIQERARQISDGAILVP